MAFTDVFVTYKQPFKTLLWALAGVLISMPIFKTFSYFSYTLLVLSFFMIILAIFQFIKINEKIQAEKKAKQ